MKNRLIILFLTLVSALQVSSQGFDARLLHSINGADGRALTNMNKFVSNSEAFVLVGVPVGMAIYDCITKDMDHLDKTLGVTASLVATYAVSLTVKSIVKRERPFEAHPGYIIRRAEADGYSFPSNHTGGAFAMATSLSLNFPKWYVIAPAYTWASLVGYSRMQLGVHYPSDVLVGAILGSACAYGTYQAQKWWTGRRKLKKSGYALQAYTY